MRSYLDILTEINEAIESDSIPANDKLKITQHVLALLELLLKYSD